MRELKFRAWRNIDGKLRRYVFSPFAYKYPDPDEPVFHAEYGVNDIRDFMPLADIIEQYTGLKDKKGKEIYEGDIIEGSWLYGKDRHIVKYVDYGFYPFTITDFDGDSMIRNVDIEIIGNIHENPELMEGEEK